MHPFAEWLMINVGSKQAEEAMSIVEQMLHDERERCCKIIYGQCSSDNTAARTVEAIRGRCTSNPGVHHITQRDGSCSCRQFTGAA